MIKIGKNTQIASLILMLISVISFFGCFFTYTIFYYEEFGFNAPTFLVFIQLGSIIFVLGTSIKALRQYKDSSKYPLLHRCMFPLIFFTLFSATESLLEFNESLPGFTLFLVWDVRTLFYIFIIVGISICYTLLNASKKSESTHGLKTAALISAIFFFIFIVLQVNNVIHAFNFYLKEINYQEQLQSALHNTFVIAHTVLLEIIFILLFISSLRMAICIKEKK